MHQPPTRDPNHGLGPIQIACIALLAGPLVIGLVIAIIAVWSSALFGD